MAKETSVTLTEVWQLLIEYIPRRDQEEAADELVRYLAAVLSQEEMNEISEIDGDLSDAYVKYQDEDAEMNSAALDDELYEE